MAISVNFNELVLPPKLFLYQILDSVSRVYCNLWEVKDKKSHISMTWKDVCTVYSKNSFRTSLRKLANCGLLHFSENDNGVEIELVEFDDVEELV